MLPSLLRCYSLELFVGSYCFRSVLVRISVPVPVPAPDSVPVSVSAPDSDPAPDPVRSFPSLGPAYSLGGAYVYRHRAMRAELSGARKRHPLSAEMMTRANASAQSRLHFLCGLLRYFASSPSSLISYSFPSLFPFSSPSSYPLLLSFFSPLPSPFSPCVPRQDCTPVPVLVPAHPRSHLAFILVPPPPFVLRFPFRPHHRRSRPGSRPRSRCRLRFRPRLRSCPRPRTRLSVLQTWLSSRYEARVQTPVCECECVCMFTWLHITAQFSPIILVITHHSYLSSQEGMYNTYSETI